MQITRLGYIFAVSALAGKAIGAPAPEDIPKSKKAQNDINCETKRTI